MGVIHQPLEGHSGQGATGHVIHRGEFVVAEPDGGRVIARKTHVPGIAIGLRGAGLAAGDNAVLKRAPPGRAHDRDGYQHLVHLRIGIFGQHALGGRLVMAEIVKDVALIIQDLLDAVAARLHATGREHGIGGGLIENRYFGRAERNGLVAAQRRSDAHCFCGIDDDLRAEHVLGEPHRHGVIGLGKRHLQRDLAGIGAAVILRRPATPRHRRIRDQRFRLHALFHGGRIGIDLERRTRLAQRRRGAVELAFAIVPPTDHGANAAAIFDHHDRALLDAVTLAIFAELHFHRLFRRLLQAGIDGGAHNDGVIPELALGGQTLHLVESPVEEIIGRLDVFAVDDGSGIAPCADHLALSHQPALHEVGKNGIRAGARRRQVDVRRIFGRRLEQARKDGGFGQRHVGQVLAKVKLRRRSSTEGAAAHVGAVEIEGEDFLLRHVGLEPQREEGFLDLALQRALIGQKQVLGELLRQRRAALHHAAGTGVFAHGAGKADEVDAEMVEEAPVLGRQHRLDEMIGHLVDRHGIFMDDPAMADGVAITVEKGDGEITPITPVLLGFLKGWHGQSQQHDGASGSESQRVAGEIDKELLPAADMQLARGDGDIFPEINQPRASRPQAAIDEAIDPEQDVPFFPAFFIVFFVLHLAMFSCSRQCGRRYFCASTHSRRKTVAWLCRNCLTWR
ncbi:hypothetical protein AT6N2_C1446 [Agrobacterium tumefaciens]|nr:hypothetical protein AT6N2_C1446 [Agrobacterium tumefaciens]